MFAAQGEAACINETSPRLWPLFWLLWGYPSVSTGIVVRHRNPDPQMFGIALGYSSAYDKAMAQFNAEQGQSKDLANLMSTQGGIERGIESEGISADKEEFEKQRQYPFQQVQFQRDMISGLPTGSVQNTPGQMTSVGQLLSALGGGTAAAKAFGYKDVTELLKGLGLSTGS
jgi:hypothetical protein